MITGKRSKKRSRCKGMTMRCRHCPKWTPNRGGVCCRCLDLVVPNAPPPPPKPAVLSGREIAKLLKPGIGYVPHAVARGRGFKWPS